MSCASGRGPLGAASSLQSDFPPLPTRGGYCRKNCPFSTIHGLSAASLAPYLLPALYIAQSQTAHHTSSPLGASAAYTHTVWCAQPITQHYCYLKNNPYVYFTQLLLSKKQPLRTSPNQPLHTKTAHLPTTVDPRSPNRRKIILDENAIWKINLDQADMSPSGGSSKI